MSSDPDDLIQSPRIGYAVVQSDAHRLPGHPESPGRFSLLGDLEGMPIQASLARMDPVSAPQIRLETVHDPGYIQALSGLSSEGITLLDGGDTYALKTSFGDALNAAGAAMQVVESVWTGETDSGFALIRPPGHHATQSRGMGFCLLNNIALAARAAQDLGCGRVLIVDFDVHHGNGTQAIFEADPDVYFLSVHQFGIYPGTGHLQEMGLGAGRGTVLNAPLPAFAGDVAFDAVGAEIIEPFAARASPDILLISAGFDAHWRDPLGNLQVSTGGFYRMASRLRSIAAELCGGRLVFVLEGGYEPGVLIESVQAVFHAMAGQPAPPDKLGASGVEEPDISRVLSEIRRAHAL